MSFCKHCDEHTERPLDVYYDDHNPAFCSSSCETDYSYLECRVSGKPELMDLPLGAEVLDFTGRAWTRGSVDGSCVNLTRPGNMRAILRFYQPIVFTDGHWRLCK